MQTHHCPTQLQETLQSERRPLSIMTTNDVQTAHSSQELHTLSVWSLLAVTTRSPWQRITLIACWWAETELSSTRQELCTGAGRRPPWRPWWDASSSPWRRWDASPVISVGCGSGDTITSDDIIWVEPATRPTHIHTHYVYPSPSTNSLCVCCLLGYSVSRIIKKCRRIFTKFWEGKWKKTKTTTGLRLFVRDYPGATVPEETFTHSPSWSSSSLYQLLPSTTIHSILLFELRAWQSFCTTSLHVLFGLPLGLDPSTSYSIHFFTQSVSSFRNTSILSQPVLL